MGSLECGWCAACLAKAGGPSGSHQGPKGRRALGSCPLHTFVDGHPPPTQHMGATVLATAHRCDRRQTRAPSACVYGPWTQLDPPGWAVSSSP